MTCYLIYGLQGGGAYRNFDLSNIPPPPPPTPPPPPPPPPLQKFWSFQYSPLPSPPKKNLLRKAQRRIHGIAGQIKKKLNLKLSFAKLSSFGNIYWYLAQSVVLKTVSITSINCCKKKQQPKETNHETRTRY